MKSSKNKSYLNWLKKSGEDELSAEWLLKERKGASSTVCFLAQQIVEKNMKGFLEFHKKPFKKTHDLIALESVASEVCPKIEKFHEDFKLLNTFYIESRYPGDLEFTWKLAELGFRAALKIKKFILNQVENEPNGN
jgi:HEPN domain-containing protein